MSEEKSAKAILNELVAKKIGVIVSMESIDDVTLSGSKIFKSKCIFKKANENLLTGEGTGTKKKVSEQNACQDIIDKLNLTSIQTPPKLLNDGRTFVISSESSHPHPSSIQTEVQNTAIKMEPEDLPEILEQATSGNSNKIGELQEVAQKNKLTSLQYFETEWTGPDKRMRYKVICKFNGIQKQGVAINKGDAKKIAAFKILQAINSVDLSQAPPIPKPRTSINKQPVAKTPNKEIHVTPNIVYYENFIIGEGGTSKVYKGYFKERTLTLPAAIKICSHELIHHTNKELEILRKVQHPNIINYFMTEDKDSFSYIVMELAECSLEDVVISKINDRKLLKKFLADVTNGLNELHKEIIVHRDLKPKNILIFNGTVAKLADFGISKELDSATQGVVTEAYRGTFSYMPPEGLKAIGNPAPFTLMPSFDIFSLAVTICYTMTGGKHLFAIGESDPPAVIQSNIINNKFNWAWISRFNEYFSLKNLLSAMISLDPTKRPVSACVLEHPFFWEDKKGLDFIEAVSNDLKNNKDATTSADCRTEIARMYARFCNTQEKPLSWRTRLCPELEDFLTHRDQLRATNPGKLLLNLKSYKGANFLKLVEFIRDHYQHYEEWGNFRGGVLKHNIFGENGENYITYFLNTFPELTTLLYLLFQEEKYRGLHSKDFYKINEACAFDVFNFM